jgi:hypothetical protein
MKRIEIDFVEQEAQNYPTLGDYGETEYHTWFKITKFPDKPAYSIAVLIHEICEFYRNQQEGISIAAVDAFDLGHLELDEPGLSLDAPYHATHMEADALERLFILFSGEDWVEYEAACEKMFP